MEAIVAMVVAVVAAMGLAYTFGIGRGNIDRFEIARVADAVAQSQMDSLVVLDRSQPGGAAFLPGVHPSPAAPFLFHEMPIGSRYWRVDPAPADVPSSIRGNMVMVTSEVAWVSGELPDTVRYSRLFEKQ